MSVEDRIKSIDLAALKARINGRRIVASVSCGKDSAAMSLLLTELGLEHSRVFWDTGWEHPSTYEYLRGPLTDALGEIDEGRSSKYRGMVDLIIKKGMFPSGDGKRFCTQELKIKPAIEYFNGLDCEAVNCVGIRAAESQERAKMPEWEYSDALDCEVWRPLMHWTEADVIEMHHRHNLSPWPMYLRGASRCGCWPCINANKEDLKFLAREDPERISLIREIEKELGDKAQARDANNTRPTFFRAMGALRSEGQKRVPIDDVIKWAMTSRGGSQFEMFAAAGRDAGCVRWGLCDLAIDATASERKENK